MTPLFLSANVECYAHLPGIIIEPGHAHYLGAGELVALEVDTWRRIDWTLPDAVFEYRLAKPVFFHTFIEARPGDGDHAAALSHLLVGPYEALLIGTAQPLADPHRSVSYLKSGSQWLVRLGLFQHGYAVYGEEQFRVAVSIEDLERSRAVLPMLKHCATPEARVGVATLKRTAHPEFSDLNAFVHHISFLEMLLIPELTHGLTEAFGQRGAVVFSDTEDELDADRELCRGLYRVRSEILHGDDPSQAIARAGHSIESVLATSRALAACAVWRLMAFAWDRGPTHGTTAALRRDLAGAWDDAGLRATLRESWTPVT